jgi:hypothetical protein
MRHQEQAAFAGSSVILRRRSAWKVACVSIDWAGPAPQRVSVISDSAEHAGDLALRLGDLFQLEFFHPDELSGAGPGELTFVDINLKDAARVSTLKRWLERRPKHGQAIFGPYRAPVSGTEAYQILQDMGSKLDRDLVRAFRSLAQSVD